MDAAGLLAQMSKNAKKPRDQGPRGRMVLLFAGAGFEPTASRYEPDHTADPRAKSRSQQRWARGIAIWRRTMPPRGDLHTVGGESLLRICELAGQWAFLLWSGRSLDSGSPDRFRRPFLGRAWARKA